LLPFSILPTVANFLINSSPIAFQTAITHPINQARSKRSLIRPAYRISPSGLYGNNILIDIHLILQIAIGYFYCLPSLPIPWLFPTTLGKLRQVGTSV
jgi:adenylate kinase